MSIVEEARGHRSVPHTADVIIEAWAPTFGGCVEEAVLALVEQFAEPVEGVEPVSRELAVDATGRAGALIGVLEEAIFVTEVEGMVPVGLSVDRAGATGVRGRLSVVAVGDAVQIGSVPKAVSWRELEVMRSSSGWRCRVTIDV